KAWEFMVLFLIKDVGGLETSVDDRLVHFLMAVFDPPSSYVGYLHPDMQLSGTPSVRNYLSQKWMYLDVF
uniref:Uncharacterized protein n=1 Tax=Aegilops tauschii subsp. strangulata TaxID=200361 RepID=A0A453PLE6_AEGTS